MNYHDRENLKFLLTATPETLKDWYDKVDPEDHEYAMHLIKTHHSEVIIEQLEKIDRETTDFTEARKILAQF